MVPIFNFQFHFPHSTDFQITSEVCDCLKVWLMLTSGNWGEADAKLLNKIFTGQWISGTPFANSKEELRIVFWWSRQWGKEIVTKKAGLTPPSATLVLEVEKGKIRGEVLFEDSSSRISLPSAATQSY